AFTHKNVDLKDLGNLVICDEELESRLLRLKATFDTPEIFYIGTCNRVEFVFYGDQELNDEFKSRFIDSLGLCCSEEQRHSILNQVNTYDGRDAINHLFRISCSLESLVV